VQRLQSDYQVAMLCETFGIHRSSYKYWSARSKQPSREPNTLHEQVKSAHQASRGSAGARTIAAMVSAKGMALFGCGYRPLCQKSRGFCDLNIAKYKLNRQSFGDCF